MRKLLRRGSSVALVALALTVLVGCLGNLPVPLPSAPSPPTTAGSSAEASLPTLTVSSPSPVRYERSAWQPDGWEDLDRDGCNTRKEVLIVESLDPVHTSGRSCTLVGGRWRDWFSGHETSDATELQIDHLVSLADAHRSGGWAWTADRKIAFANDLDTDELNAVGGALNQAKADDGPDGWLPDDPAAQCDYVAAYVRVKEAWGLSVTLAQSRAITDLWARCWPTN